MKSRFSDMAEVRAERARLRVEASARMARLEGHWDALRDPTLQRSMARGVAGALWKAFRPSDALRDIAHDSPGALGALAGLLLGGQAHTWWGRIVTSALGATITSLVPDDQRVDRAGRVLHEVGTSWDRVKAYVRERREARRTRD